jgi:formylmethanofuran dehydrogenase subunit E
MNERKVSHEDAILELIKAGEDVYTWEFVEVPVPMKTKKDVVICPICCESFIKKDNNELCKGCLDVEL